MESIAIADAALQWGAGGESKKFCCEPRYLIFAKGTAMVVVGSESEPGLNGSKGVVEDFDELERMYEVQLEGQRETTQLRPENCRVLVPGFEGGGRKSPSFESPRSQ